MRFIFSFLMVIGAVPFMIPFVDWVYYGILFANFGKFPVVVFLCIGWDILYSRAAPESFSIINEDIRGVGYTTSVAFGQFCLAFMRWPTFLAAMYAITH